MPDCNANSATLTMFADLKSHPDEPALVRVRFVIRYCTQKSAEHFQNRETSELDEEAVIRRRSEHKLLCVRSSRIKPNNSSIFVWKKSMAEKLVDLMVDEFKKQIDSETDDLAKLKKTVRELLSPNKITTDQEAVSFGVVQELL